MGFTASAPSLGQVCSVGRTRRSSFCPQISFHVGIKEGSPSLGSWRCPSLSLCKMIMSRVPGTSKGTFPPSKAPHPHMMTRCLLILDLADCLESPCFSPPFSLIAVLQSGLCLCLLAVIITLSKFLVDFFFSFDLSYDHSKLGRKHRERPFTSSPWNTQEPRPPINIPHWKAQLWPSVDQQWQVIIIHIPYFTLVFTLGVIPSVGIADFIRETVPRKACSNNLVWGLWC